MRAHHLSCSTCLYISNSRVGVVDATNGEGESGDKVCKICQWVLKMMRRSILVSPVSRNEDMWQTDCITQLSYSFFGHIVKFKVQSLKICQLHFFLTFFAFCCLSFNIAISTVPWISNWGIVIHLSIYHKLYETISVNYPGCCEAIFLWQYIWGVKLEHSHIHDDKFYRNNLSTSGRPHP